MGRFGGAPTWNTLETETPIAACGYRDGLCGAGHGADPLPV